MAHPTKVWKDEPDHTTPMSAAAIIDLEDRAMTYADDVAATLGANYRGVWSSATTYALGDAVSKSGLSYISTVGSNTNHDPSADDGTHWAGLPSDSRLPIIANRPPYNAVNDGVIHADGTVTGTDNVAKIQAALDAAKAAGGGDVWITIPGVYLLSTVNSGDGLSWHLSVNGDHVHLRLAKGVILASTQNAQPVGIHGYAKTFPMTTWQTTGYFAARTTYAMNTPVVKGANQITLTTAGDASHFSAGDAIVIRTGHLVGFAGAYPNGTPDAELNEVVSADAGTGIVKLKWPTEKDYSPEYYQAGTPDGPTTRVVSGTPAPCGLINIQDSCIRDVGVHGGQIFQNGAVNWHAVQYYQAIGITIEDVIVDGVPGVEGNVGATSGQMCRDFDFSFRKNDFTGTGTAFGVSTGCSSGRVRGRARSADGIAAIEISEGACHIEFDMELESDPAYSGTDERAVAAGLRNRDIDLKLTVKNHFAGVAVLCQQDLNIPASEQSGNTLRLKSLGTFAATTGSTARIIGPGWRILEERSPSSNPALVHGSDHSGQQPVEVGALCGMVHSSDAAVNIALGSLPLFSFVIGVYIQVFAAFNAGGNNLLDVGYVGATQAFVLAQDVSSVGLKAPAVAQLGYQNVNRDVVATYRDTGAAPSTGGAFVIVLFAKTNVNPNA